MALQITVFKTVSEAAAALADSLRKDLQQALASSTGANHDRALLLVSGGRSPLPLFDALAQQPLPWQQIDVSLVDERSVPPDHPDSNAALVCTHLLKGPASAASFLPLMDAAQQDADPWRWAQQSATTANARPALAKPDAIVLGLGGDGHTASLFADSPQWQDASTTTTRYIAIQPGQAPHARVSLSLQALIAQGSCYVWSTGADKMAVIKLAQALAASVTDGVMDGAALHKAGPFALLVADPRITLRVFHSEQ